ncbi:MAG: sodium:solute symporter family protein [Bacteroidetes bacterium]|nr:sodium:solute symporter family protein [Bacteroidota bacterium]
MHWIDILIFAVYFLLMLGIGFYFFKKNETEDDYYVGGRKMGSLHIGLSVVATDVGGGFSIGLGGLGFLMGISGSWMLFTGLIGAWLAAVFLIPKVSELARNQAWLTFPQLFKHFFNRRVALLAGVISAIGYIGFTSSQILAGAKLASATFLELDLNSALLIMGIIAVLYTVIGGLQAVIYTDTAQWIILMGGLIFIGIPMGYYAIGGIDAIRDTLSSDFLSLQNVSWSQLVNWGITIIPIWFVGMTLYQRIYACKDEKTAKRAWYIAGLFEYPIMAFMGVLLGLFSRVGAEQGMFLYAGFETAAGIDPEMGLPMLLRTVLPVGLTGLMLSAYFSAIMSTADSCLIAASGNVVTDILMATDSTKNTKKKNLRISQVSTLVIGAMALLLAASMQNVLELMLYSYAFMVSGLFIPVLAALYSKRPSSTAAFWAMLGGGSTTLIFVIADIPLPYDLDANIAGISVSAILYLIISSIDHAGLLPGMRRAKTGLHGV